MRKIIKEIIDEELNNIISQIEDVLTNYLNYLPLKKNDDSIEIWDYIVKQIKESYEPDQFLIKIKEDKRE